MEHPTLATNHQQKQIEVFLEQKALRQAGITPPKSKKTPRPDRVRRKDWLSDNLDDPDAYYDQDIDLAERIVPKGETERKRTQALTTAATADVAAPPAARPVEGSRGVVIEVSSGLCRVRLDARDLICEIRQSLRSPHSGFANVVAVGDRVLVNLNGADRGYVEGVLPRRSALARPDVFYPHLQQVIVANVDQLLIVASWREPQYWPELVDRYLISAQRNNLASIICVNKVDLAPAGDPGAPRRKLEVYRELGVQVLYSSAQTGEGVDELRALLRGRTTALAGLSGVGKSSLLRAAEPGLDLKVGEVSERKHEGRHTTTQVSLHPLAAGGFVVDTPGIREFGLSGMKPADVLRYYPDLGFVGQGCRFEDCAHLDEDGCAVRAAAGRGRVSAMRYDSYKKIRAALGA
jgi:ribosome biogenesis GTPase